MKCSSFSNRKYCEDSYFIRKFSVKMFPPYQLLSGQCSWGPWSSTRPFLGCSTHRSWAGWPHQTPQQHKAAGWWLPHPHQYAVSTWGLPAATGPFLDHTCRDQSTKIYLFIFSHFFPGLFPCFSQPPSSISQCYIKAESVVNSCFCWNAPPG